MTLLITLFHSCNLTFFTSVKKKHAQVLRKIDSEYEAALQVSDRRLTMKEQQWKARLSAIQESVQTKKEKWCGRLNKIEADLSNAKDNVYIKKVK
jgi:hypothetical protein